MYVVIFFDGGMGLFDFGGVIKIVDYDICVLFCESVGVIKVNFGCGVGYNSGFIGEYEKVFLDMDNLVGEIFD